MKTTKFKHLIPKGYRRLRMGEFSNSNCLVISGNMVVRIKDYAPSWGIGRVAFMEIPILIKKSS